MAEGTEFNIIQHDLKPPMLVDEVSSTEYYIGHSKNSKLKNKSNWRIQRIWKVGSVWNFGYPDGNQNFDFMWDLRDTYTYSA